jgi:hypothetical protein
MTSSVIDSELDVRSTEVAVTDDTLTVDLEDGRTIVVPTVWFPRLTHGTAKERENYEISGLGIHWPELDEDISIRGLLLGRKSGENPRIIKWWLQQRSKGRKVTFEDYMREKAKKQQKPKKASRKAS